MDSAEVPCQQPLSLAMSPTSTPYGATQDTVFGMMLLYPQLCKHFQIFLCIAYHLVFIYVSRLQFTTSLRQKLIRSLLPGDNVGALECTSVITISTSKHYTDFLKAEVNLLEHTAAISCFTKRDTVFIIACFVNIF